MRISIKSFVVFQSFAMTISLIFGIWGDSNSFLNIGYQTWTFLTSDQDSFNDFYGDRFEHLGDYHHMEDAYWGQSTLPPIAILIGKFFYFIPVKSSLVVFILMNLVCITLLTIKLSKQRNTLLLVALVFSSYPLLFAIFRGNNDIYILSFLLAIYIVYQSKNLLLTSLLLGVLGALEPLMFLYFPLFLLRSEHKIRFLFFYLVAYCSSWYSPAFHGDRDISRYFEVSSKSSKLYFESMVISDNGLLFGNSLFGLLKAIYYKINFQGVIDPAVVGQSFRSSFLLNYYLYLAILLGILICFAIYRENNFEIQLLLVGCMIILLPYVSALYKLVLLLFNLIIFLSKTDSNNKRIRIISLFVLLIIVPKNFIWIKFSFNPTGLTLESILNPLLILLLILYVYFSLSKTKSSSIEPS